MLFLIVLATAYLLLPLQALFIWLALRGTGALPGHPVQQARLRVRTRPDRALTGRR